MVDHRHAEHFKLGSVPSGDDIDGVAAAADVIDHGRLLGGHDRMDGRNVRGGEHGRIFGRGRHSGCPAEAFESGAIEIGLAAEALPAPDRHQRFEFHLVRYLREPQRVGPGDLQGSRHGGDGATAAQIGAERTELQLAVVEQRIGGATQFFQLGITGHWNSPLFCSSVRAMRHHHQRIGSAALGAVCNFAHLL